LVAIKYKTKKEDVIIIEKGIVSDLGLDLK
jgi:hypothetical protein